MTTRTDAELHVEMVTKLRELNLLLRLAAMRGFLGSVDTVERRHPNAPAYTYTEIIIAGLES